MNKELNLGSRVRSKAMQTALVVRVLERIAELGVSSYEDKIVVHHCTDTPDYLQLELEVRYKDGSCKFSRIRL